MVSSAHRLPFSWRALHYTLCQDNFSCCGIIFKQMSVLSLTSTTEKDISSGMEWDSASQRKHNRNQLLLHGQIGCALTVVSVRVQEQRVPPNPSLAGCTLTPWTWAMLHFWFHKAAARFGEEVRTFKIRSFPSKIKVKIQKQVVVSSFYLPLSLQAVFLPESRLSVWVAGSHLCLVPGHSSVSASLLLILTLS